MEAAKQLWSADEWIGEIVQRAVRTRRPIAEIIDEIGPVALTPGDRWKVLREGARSLANDKAGGIRSFRRSGKVQSAETVRRPVEGEEAGLEEWWWATLERLVFETADGGLAPVLEFTHEDALHARRDRVDRLREIADREEPFWDKLIELTRNGWTLERRADKYKREMAMLAIQAGLTDGPER